MSVKRRFIIDLLFIVMIVLLLCINSWQSYELLKMKYKIRYMERLADRIEQMLYEEER